MVLQLCFFFLIIIIFKALHQQDAFTGLGLLVALLSWINVILEKKIQR